MAESITEGTLKSWSKQVGDSVAADEEVATIETDKIDVSVNAPQAGKIVEHGTVNEIFDSPKEAYTQRLLSAIPSRDPAMQALLAQSHL